METTLIIDFSSTQSSITLLHGQTADKVTVTEDRKHSELFLDILDGLLKKNNLELKDIQRIFLSKDPGSYTSLRVAFASVKAFAMALQIPIYVFSKVEDLENLSPEYLK
jgi:tRNA threonylcarbamoyladenosine biosynthesis protein TsaB